MTSRRLQAAAGALFGTLAVAGCGLGPGPSIGDVQLTVTRDYGTRPLLRKGESSARQSETAMRLLDRNADIKTRYGGRFVQSVNGVAGGSSGGRSFDWFFYIDGVESPVGAADYPLHAGYRVWWDYRDWTAAMRVPAVVGSYPEPFRHGYEGKRHPLAVICRGAARACSLARGRLRTAAGDAKAAGDPIRVLVGPWGRLSGDSAAHLIAKGPADSGVFADFVPRAGSWLLQPLDVAGDPAGAPRKAGLVAATREGDDPPTWVVTGAGEAEVAAAARLLDPADLRDRYAVATGGGKTTALPLP